MTKLSLDAFQLKAKNSTPINLRAIIGGNSDSCDDEKKSKKPRSITMEVGNQ